MSKIQKINNTKQYTPTLSPRVIFYHSLKRKNRWGTAPVLCRITLMNKRIDFSTGVFVKPGVFKNGDIEPVDELTMIFHTKLNDIRNRLYKAEVDFRLQNKPINIELMKRALSEGVIYSSSFKEISEYYLKVQEELIDVDFQYAAYLKKKYTVKHIKSFIQHEFQRTDYDCDEITENFAKRFELYSKTILKHGNWSIKKSMQTLKAIINFGVMTDRLKKNYLIGFKTKSIKKKELLHLSLEQIRILSELKFSAQALTYTRDAFLFQCFTGLAFSDLKNFSETDIQEINGAHWIVLHRQKTVNKCTIILLPDALAIINRYKDLNHRCDHKITNSGMLPIYKNSVYNRLLKQIGLIANIPTDLMVSHSGRRTFAMVILNSGVSLESVSKMLGHSRLEVTQKHYSYINTDRIKREVGEFLFIKPNEN